MASPVDHSERVLLFLLRVFWVRGTGVWTVREGFSVGHSVWERFGSVENGCTTWGREGGRLKGMAGVWTVRARVHLFESVQVASNLWDGLDM